MNENLALCDFQVGGLVDFSILGDYNLLNRHNPGGSPSKGPREIMMSIVERWIEWLMQIKHTLNVSFSVTCSRAALMSDPALKLNL